MSIFSLTKKIVQPVRKVDTFLRRWIALPVPWFVVMPAFVAVIYWFSFHEVAFTDGSLWRIPALPKVFFDQTMYLQVLAKDLLHGFHILPFALKPFVVLARAAWPAVSLSELYVIGVIVSAIASVWVFGAFIRRVGDLDASSARMRSLAAFLLVQSILVLRPAGPSWYVPFFILALLFVWISETAWAKKQPVRALTLWAAALILSSVYPWYFATIAALIGLLFLLRFVRPHYVIPGVVAGLTLTGAAFLLRDRIVDVVTSSYAVMLAYYGGVQFSHLTTLSNTVLLMLGWIVLWLPSAVRAARQDSHFTSPAVFFLASWLGLAILWFQSLLTGLSIVPDHFIYSVWLVSALSWAVWRTPQASSDSEKRIRSFISALAILYVFSVVFRIISGTYDWTAYPSLVIHIGSWIFLVFTALPISRTTAVRTVFVLGILSACVGAAAVRSSAFDRAEIDREMDGVRSWIMDTHPSLDLRWCSDALASDYIFSVTGADSYPNFSNKHDPVSITQIQNRMIELSAFFSPIQAEELYIWDDMILHDLDFPCRVFGPGIRLITRLPLSDETKTFLSGCNQAWADGERARVIRRFEERWVDILPETSVLCDRFIVRKRLRDAWRIPASYSLLYEDGAAEVYGRIGP